MVQSFKAVCKCRKERPECSDCGAGFNQEVAAGRVPLVVLPKDVLQDSVPPIGP